MPADSRFVTWPGTAPTARPSSAAKSAVVSEPGALGRLYDDRGRAERGDDPVAGDEAPAIGLHARRKLGDHRAALVPRRRAAAGRAPGRGRARSPASTPIVGPGASSAPAWAAESTPRARPETTGDPRRREPAPERARDLEPVARGPARADHGDRRLRRPAKPGVTQHVQHGGRVGELAQALGVVVRQPHTTARPASDARARAAVASKCRVAPPDTAPGAPSSSSVLVREREHAAGRGPSLELHLEVAGDGSDQVGPAQAVVARGHGLSLPPPRRADICLMAGWPGSVTSGRRGAGAAAPRCAGHVRADQTWPAHAASASWTASSRRRLAATLMCCGPTMSEPSRSATVRPTRRMRVWPRADSEWRS